MEGETENKLGFNTNMPFFVLNSWPTLFSVTHTHTHTLCSVSHTRCAVFRTHNSQYTRARLLNESSVLTHTHTHTQAIQHTVRAFLLAKLPTHKVSIYQPDTHRAAAGLSSGIYDILQHLGCS